MTRNTIACIALATLAILWAGITLTFAQDVGESAIAPSSMFYDLWTIVQPLVVLLVSTVGPVLVTWIAARLINLLKITDQKQQVELETKLREALHQSAANGLKYAMVRAGVPAGVGSMLPDVIVRDAIAYVNEKNSDSLKKLDVHPDALRDIIMSKIPDLIKAVK